MSSTYVQGVTSKQGQRAAVKTLQEGPAEEDLIDKLKENAEEDIEPRASEEREFPDQDFILVPPKGNLGN